MTTLDTTAQIRYDSGTTKSTSGYPHPLSCGIFMPTTFVVPTRIKPHTSMTGRESQIQHHSCGNKLRRLVAVVEARRPMPTKHCATSTSAVNNRVYLAVLDNSPLSINSSNAWFKPKSYSLAYCTTSSSNGWGILNSNLTISISPTNSLLVSWLCLLGFLVLPFWLCLLALALSSASLTNLNMSKTAWGGRLSDTIITPKKNIDVIIPNKPSLLLKVYQSVSSKLDIIGQIRYNVGKVLETPYRKRILLRLANLFLPITLTCPAYTWASVSYGQDEPIREDGCTTFCVFSTSCPPLARNKGQISQKGVISNV